MSVDSSNIYKRAVFKNLRFTGFGGSLTVEDVLQIGKTPKGLQKLNAEAIRLRKLTADEDSGYLRGKKNPAKTDDLLRHALLVDILETLQDNMEKQARIAENRTKRDTFLAIMAEKDQAELKNKSMEELKDMLRDLNLEEETEY